MEYTGYGAVAHSFLAPSLFPLYSYPLLIIGNPFEPFYRPAWLKPIQINKAPGSIHWLFYLSVSCTWVYSFFRLKAKIYIISSMPNVLTMNRTMNQMRWAFLPALHRATPFHAINHTIARDATSHIMASVGKNGHDHPIGIFRLLMSLRTHHSAD